MLKNDIFIINYTILKSSGTKEQTMLELFGVFATTRTLWRVKMAIIECSHCKELFNEDEQFCPYCGEEAAIHLSPIHRERNNKPQKGRKLILGMPLGKWIAAAVFLVAALLIILCVYICLSLSGKIKDDAGITNKINASAIGDLTKVESDSSSKVISDDKYGTITSTKVKGYDLFESKTHGFSILIPSGFKVTESDGSVFVCQELDENGEYTLPCVIIDDVTDFTDEAEFLQDKHSDFAKAYADQNFSLLENLVKFSQGDKTVFEFQFSYTTQGYEILDTRRAIKVNDSLFSIASKELADKTICVSEEEINNILESFKLN